MVNWYNAEGPFSSSEVNNIKPNMSYSFNAKLNKKVLLRERKRHTARRVVSTPSVVLTGYPPPAGYPPPQPDLAGGGTPPGRVPPRQGTPQQGTPRAGYPLAGYPPWLDLAGYPPRCLPHGILGNVAKHYGIRVTPPLWTDRKTRVKI